MHRRRSPHPREGMAPDIVWGKMNGHSRCGSHTCSQDASSECAWFVWMRQPRTVVEVFDPFVPVPEEDVGLLTDWVFYIFGILVAVTLPVRPLPHPLLTLVRARVIPHDLFLDAFVSHAPPLFRLAIPWQLIACICSGVLFHLADLASDMEAFKYESAHTAPAPPPPPQPPSLAKQQPQMALELT